MVMLLLIASLFAITGCGPESQISFRICSKLAVPEQLDALRISTLDETLTERNFALIELTAREIATEADTDDNATENSDRRSNSEDAQVEGDGDKSNKSQDVPSTTTSLPIIVSLKADSGPGYVRVQALLKGVEIARFERQVPDLDVISAVDMPLTEACYGRYNCALGQTCVKGDCVVAPFATDPPICD